MGSQSRSCVADVISLVLFHCLLVEISLFFQPLKFVHMISVFLASHLLPPHQSPRVRPRV